MSSGGYGIFFQAGNIDGYGECMLTVLIRTTGQYAIGKVIDGNYTEINGWKDGTYLRRGYGVKNSIKVVWDNETAIYVLYINGMEEVRFIDLDSPQCSGGGSGVAAVITKYESFPESPVKVRYRIYE
ncbi:hypothetical protein K7I13_11035 [Brucepastera parasyntrophica]|uniref:hypothetical protein n=1 Tax=Brucepastera parasyntrophica TaxID=2880008 RepID=UPI00210E7895|nr:hypothetical protein [Brucepastera parasyntrophica]ULQ59042.1 hypothetical protein K7I13_11035 [Brucepastera parasyntrophica]